MDIFRPINGVYRNISNPKDERRYVLREYGKNHFPVLEPVGASYRAQAEALKPDFVPMTVKKRMKLPFGRR